jgi:chromate transporter
MIVLRDSRQPEELAVGLWELFVSFFKIGLFTFGGGYAMLPLVEKEVIDKKGWTDKEEILNIYALAQSVPGVIAVNTSIFLGSRLRGLPGALAATVGVISPSLIIILFIASFFTQINSNVHVLNAFNGIRAGVAGLVAAAAVRIWLGACKNKTQALIGLGAFILGVFTDIHAALIILSGGLAGLAVSLWKRGSGHGSA